MKNRIIRIFSLPVLMASPVFVFAQATEASNPRFWEDAFGSMTLLGGAIVIVGALLTIVRLFNAIMKMEELRILREKGVEEIVEAYRQPQESWWSKFLKTATKTVPVAEESEIIMSHNYDGIRELDNKLPPWWLWLFYVSIIFSIVYWFAFHVTGSAPSIHEEYKTEMETAQAAVAAFVARQADNVDENSVVQLTDPNELSLGESIFTTNCATCHGKLGEGLAGPNLTDDYWLHGGGIKDVFKTIKYGVPGKAMVSWKDLLRSSDIQRVASYILTLKGTNPPNPKAPEGDLWKPEQQPEPDQQPTETTTESGDKLSLNTN